MLHETLNVSRCKDAIVIFKRWKFWSQLLLTCFIFLASSSAVASEEKLVLRVPKPHRTVDPWWTIDPKNPASVSGFIPELYRELEDFANLTIVTVPVEPEYVLNVSGVTKKLLDDNKIDMGLDLSFPLESGYSYTISLLQESYRALIVQRLVKSSALQIFEPFEPKLWLVLVAILIFGSLFESLIIRVAYGRKNKKLSLLKRMTIDFYSTCATFLSGGEPPDFDNYPMLRLYQLGLLFLVLIITSTYTANLAAFLTKQSKVIIGPTTLEQLKDSEICVHWPNEAQMEILKRFVKKVHKPPEFESMQQGREWAVDQLLNKKKCDAILALDSDANRMLADNCQDLYQSPGIEFSPTPFFHIMLADTEEQKENFNRINNVFARFLSDPKYNTLVNNFLNYGGSCGNEKSKDDNDKESSEFIKIGVNEMLIPIIVYFSCSVLTLLLTITGEYWANRNDKNKADEGPSIAMVSKGNFVSNEQMVRMEKPLERFSTVDNVNHPNNNDGQISGTTTPKIDRAVSFNSPFVIRA